MITKTRSSYYDRCPKCGADDVPHSTIGLPCPTVEKRAPQPSGNDAHLARLAIRSVDRPESLELLAKEVGNARALELHDRAKAVVAEQARVSER